MVKLFTFIIHSFINFYVKASRLIDWKKKSNLGRGRSIYLYKDCCQYDIILKL